MKPSPRIALGSIFTESNCLVGTTTGLDRFALGELRRGRQVHEAKGSYVGGMLDTLHEAQAQLVPLLVASACPGGPLTTECYRQLKTELLGELKKALPVDAVLLALHGSAVVDGIGHLESDLLQETRRMIGGNVPLVATLDLHGHVTEPMVRCANILVATETYPHRDTAATGARGARLLLDTLDGNIRPAMAMAKVPVLVSGVNGHTDGAGPFADVMRYAKSLEGEAGVVSSSVFKVHPYLDLPGLGSGGLVVSDDDQERAEALARQIACRYWERRSDFEPTVYTPVEAIRRGLRINGGPVLLVETADCCGGGAAGDSVAALKALLDQRVSEPSLATVVDPEAAAICHRAGLQQEVSTTLGHKLDRRWGTPIPVRGTVMKLGDGRFKYRGGTWEGQWGNMGPSAVLQIGSLRVLITTNATYDWADEQYRSMGLEARPAKFVVVKNPMNYRLGYQGLYREAFILDSPGPTPATLRGVTLGNVARPYFPADTDIPDPVPTILRHQP